ncbi:MAG: hypothetical protein DELT_02793 [Desulfovibrio sp.]
MGSEENSAVFLKTQGVFIINMPSYFWALYRFVIIDKKSLSLLLASALQGWY